MKEENINMTGGPFAKNIIRFTVPLMLMAMLQILFIACDDMLILGAFVGSKALAAVGATNYLVNLFVNAFIGLSVGVNVVVAQSIGAEDHTKTQRAVHTAVAISVMFGILLAILGRTFSRTCLELMKTPADIIEQSAQYLRIYFLCTPATLIFSFGSAILRAQGDSKHPFIYLALAGIADVILCAFFVIVCHLDVAGVALGTLISQYISSALVIRHLMREKSVCNLSLRKLRLHSDILREILRIGIPSGISNVVFSISNMQIQSSINLLGSAAVAGCSASYTVEGFVYDATNSFMQASISFTGQNVGAKKYDNIPKVLGYCLICTSIIGTVLGGIVFLFGKPLMSLFIEPVDVEYAALRNSIVLLPYMFCGIMEAFTGTLRGLGKSTLPTIVTLVSAVFAFYGYTLPSRKLCH